MASGLGALKTRNELGLLLHVRLDLSVLGHPAHCLWNGHFSAVSAGVRVFYLLLLVIFWVPIYWVLFDIKLLLPLCWFAIFLRILPNSFYGFSNLVWRSGIAASLVAIAFLISSDAGVYSVAAFIIVFGASLFYEHHPATLVGMAKYAALTGAFFAVWVLVINLALGKLLDFHYWRDTYEIMTQYRWAQAVHMTPEMTPVFWLAVSLNLLVFVWQWVIPKKIGARERATRLAMLCFGLVTLQSLLVYSEKSHVAMGLFPWIALSVALLLGATQDSLPVSRLIASLAVILVTTGILSGPNHLFIPRNLLQDRSALTGRHTCPQGMYEIDEVCLQAVDFSELQTARDFLTQHTTASDAIGVFPYQNIYGFIARRRVVGEVLQNYLVAGDYLTLRQIKSIEDARPAWAVYAAEPWQGHTVEDISNFTRTPLLWLYWQRWYKNSFMALPGLFILRRDAERGGHWNMVSSSVLLRPPEIPRDGESALSLAPLGEDWDFIKIRLEAKYPWWWKLLKPSSFVVRIRFENGEENLVPALVQPNHPYEIWVYPWDKAQLINYFSPNGEEWHAGSRPRIQGVFLQCLQRDWISVPPSRITIYGVETIKLSER